MTVRKFVKLRNPRSHNRTIVTIEVSESKVHFVKFVNKIFYLTFHGLNY